MTVSLHVTITITSQRLRATVPDVRTVTPLTLAPSSTITGVPKKIGYSTMLSSRRVVEIRSVTRLIKYVQ